VDEHAERVEHRAQQRRQRVNVYSVLTDGVNEYHTV
jgi:hypothetical protein